MEKETNSDLINNLLDEFKIQRDELKKMIIEIDAMRENLDKLFPQKIDVRYMRFFEEKVKTATSMYDIILNMRKEITKSLKDEIEMRRKINKEEGGENLEEILEDGIAELAKKVKTFNTKLTVTKEKSVDE